MIPEVKQSRQQELLDIIVVVITLLRRDVITVKWHQ
jgi:hypothetical protein